MSRSYPKILRNRKHRIQRRLDPKRRWSEQPAPSGLHLHLNRGLPGSAVYDLSAGRHLLCWLDPVEAKTHDRDSLKKIAEQAGITKQAISKYLVELRDSLGITVGVGKRHTARQAYRNAQVKAFAEGRHASFRRKDKVS